MLPAAWPVAPNIDCADIRTAVIAIAEQNLKIFIIPSGSPLDKHLSL